MRRKLQHSMKHFSRFLLLENVEKLNKNVENTRGKCRIDAGRKRKLEQN